MILADLVLTGADAVAGGGYVSAGALLFWLLKRVTALQQRVARLEAKLGTKPPFDPD
jgi:hypothetical protein